MTPANPKPIQWSTKYAEIFKDQSVVDDYRLRPAYAPETVRILADLMANDPPRRILDAGCGTGNLARKLVQIADEVDAVDFSAAAIDRGQQLPGGDNPKLNWINASIEEARLVPPYGLITAASSLHWMEWDIVLPMFERLLSPGAVLAMVENVISALPWAEELGPVIDRYSMNKEFKPYDNRTIARHLQRRGLFQTLGEQRTGAISLSQSVQVYVGSFHSRNGLSRDRLGKTTSQEFDDRMTALVSRYCPSGEMTVTYATRVIWGYPLAAVS